MSQTKKQQSASMHRRVQISDARKHRSAQAKVTKEVNLVSTEKAESIIVHFVADPVLEGEQIQGMAAELAVDSNQPKQSSVATDKEVTPRICGYDMTNVNRQMRARQKKQRQQSNGEMCKLAVRPSAQQIKEQEIQKAVRSAGRSVRRTRKRGRKYPPVEFGFKKVFLALTCAAVAVFGIVYLVDVNSPDISLKVAAMQTGIDAVYPSYTPRGYALSDITSENGRVTLNFKNAESNGAYSLVEESVDVANIGTALSEYVAENFGTNYSRIEEQGTSVYIANNSAVWASGGVLYKLKVTSGSLTRKQIVTIATTK